MSEDSDSVSEEERSLFRPFTRESLAAIEARIAEEHAKQKELEKKRAEGEVRSSTYVHHTYVVSRASIRKGSSLTFSLLSSPSFCHFFFTFQSYTHILNYETIHLHYSSVSL